MKKKNLPAIILFAATATEVDKEKDTELSKELEAIGRVSKQLDEYKETLGDKVDKEVFKKATSEIEALKEGLENLTEKEIDAKIKEINDASTKMFKRILELEEEVNQTKEKGVRIGGQILEKLLTPEAFEKFKSERFPEGGGRGAATLEMKAAEIFGYPQTFGADGTGTGVQIDAFTGRVVDPELYQRKRKKNLILDTFNIPMISAPKLIYLEKLEIGDANPTAGDPGGADWILCGDPKPQRSFRVTTGEAEAKKVAIFGTIEDCLLKDIPSFENWIREDFRDEMFETINDGLLNNDPAINGDAPLGLKTNAIQYTATPAFAAQVENPNYIDDIIAAVALMAFNKEEAGVVYVSSDVWYRIHDLKASDGKYLNNNLVYVNNLGQLFIAGVEVRMADEEDVPSTHILVISADPGFKIRAYGNMAFETGLNGEDFRHDRTSYRAYQRFLSYLPENRENSVLYDTWANIEAAIAVPTP